MAHESIAIILPACHGKTTIAAHNPLSIWDAGEMVDSKDALSQSRADARVSNNWDNFDRSWAEMIMQRLEKSNPRPRIILMPSVSIAEHCGLEIAHIYVLPEAIIHQHLLERPKKGGYLFAFQNWKDCYNDPRREILQSRNEIASIINQFVGAE